MRSFVQSKGLELVLVEFDDHHPAHIDSTWQILRPGLILSNPVRPCLQTKYFEDQGWKVVKPPVPDIPKTWPLYFSSPWLSMNIIMLDEQHVLVEKNDPATINFFKSIGLTVIPTALRNAFSFGGGFHCWTCDIERDAHLEDYFGNSLDPLVQYTNMKLEECVPPSKYKL